MAIRIGVVLAMIPMGALALRRARNLVVTADLIVRSAMQRKESRGLHFSRDYPQQLPEAVDTLLFPR